MYFHSCCNRFIIYGILRYECDLIFRSIAVFYLRSDFFTAPVEFTGNRCHTTCQTAVAKALSIYQASCCRKGCDRRCCFFHNYFYFDIDTVVICSVCRCIDHIISASVSCRHDVTILKAKSSACQCCMIDRFLCFSSCQCQIRKLFARIICNCACHCRSFGNDRICFYYSNRCAAFHRLIFFAVRNELPLC